MDENNVIRERDLIQPDGTIEKLIRELTSLNSSYASVVDTIKQSADRIANALRSVSGATREGRKVIDDSAIAAGRYERAQKELAFAMSETGKQVAWLKAQTVDTNKATVAQQRQLAAVAGSYDKIQAEVKELVSLYRSLSEAERQEAGMGGEIISQLQAKRAQLKSIDEAVKQHVTQLTVLQKAEQKLAFLQSEEGQRLLEVRKQIRALTTARKEEKAAVDPLVQAQQRLREIQSGEKNSLYAVNLEIDKATKLAKLQAKENAAVEGSYERMSAQYARAKFQLSQLNLTLPENAKLVNNLERELNEANAAMRRFQESTGVYSMSVGNYKQAFTGVGFATQQIVRELPAMSISLNTFFLAISNNVPILIDEIRRSKLAFDAQKKSILASAASAEIAAAQIKKLEKPIQSVVKSIFSWQTAIIVVLSLLPRYADKIVDFFDKMANSGSAAERMAYAMKKIRKEMKNTNGDYGKHMVTIDRLGREYRELETDLEKTEWIKNNEDAWKELNVAMVDVADAENFFVNNTDNVKQAFKERARAAAAFKLAEDLYVELLEEEQALIEAENDAANGTNRVSHTYISGGGGGSAAHYGSGGAQRTRENIVLTHKNTIKEIQAEIDMLMNLGIAADEAAEARVGVYGDDGSGGKGGRDFTKYIENMKVKATKEAEDAITKLQRSEFEKRRKEALASYNEEIGQLQNTYNENKRILDGYYKLRKPLTDQQKKDLQAAQAQITQAMASYKAVYAQTLEDIAKDEEIATVKRARELTQLKMDAAIKGSDAEYELRKQLIEKQRQLDILENSKLIESERQDEAAINAKYDKQLTDLEAEKTIARLGVARERIALQLDAVKEGGEAEYNLRKADIQAQMAMEIAENSTLATEEQMTEEAIRAKYNKQLEDLEYEHQTKMCDIALEGIELRLGTVAKGSKQEFELLVQQIEQERKAAILANSQLAEDIRQSEDEINAYYAKQTSYAQGNYELSSFRAKQTTNKAAITSKATNAWRGTGTAVKYGAEGSRRREVYDIEQSILDVEKQIALAEAGKLDLSEEQLANLKLQRAELKNQKKELKGFNGLVSDIADGGITGGILGALGFDNEAIDAFSSAVDTVIDNINAIMDAEIEAAEAAVEASEERVNAAKEAYDAEIEARNNGYANNVETARKQLEQERKNQLEKQKLLKEAQRKQETLNSIIQVSSLITASAQLWSSMSSIPIVGPALALSAIAAMFGSFAYAKIKANQVASASTQYGEGGLEFLEGGSHASGNDIQLGTKNSKGRSMRAEGGEALAIINKRNTRRYRKELPSIIESINRGTFEDKYFNVFANSGERSISISQNNSIDLSTLENDVKGIRRNSETQYYTAPDGTVVMRYKNLKRTIKN